MKLSKKHKAVLKNFTKSSNLKWVIASILCIIIVFCTLGLYYTNEVGTYFFPLTRMLRLSTLALFEILTWFFTFKLIFPSPCIVDEDHNYKLREKIKLFLLLHLALTLFPATAGIILYQTWSLMLMLSLFVMPPIGIFVGFAIFRIIRPPVCRGCKGLSKNLTQLFKWVVFLILYAMLAAFCILFH